MVPQSQIVSKKAGTKTGITISVMRVSADLASCGVAIDKLLFL